MFARWNIYKLEQGVGALGSREAFRRLYLWGGVLVSLKVLNIVEVRAGERACG